MQFPKREPTLICRRRFSARRRATGRRLWSAVHDVRRPGYSRCAINPECRARFSGCILGQEKHPPSRMAHKMVTDECFVVSSFRNESIWYDRCNFAGQFVNCIMVNYPANEK